MAKIYDICKKQCHIYVLTFFLSQIEHRSIDVYKTSTWKIFIENNIFKRSLTRSTIYGFKDHILEYGSVDNAINYISN